jgi:hypothetical protein
MRTNKDPEAPKLCNSCGYRENIRYPKKEKPMDTVDVLIKCPKLIQAQIEEKCLNEGIDFTQYFLSLHEFNLSECKEKKSLEKVEFDDREQVFEKDQPKKTVKKKKT